MKAELILENGMIFTGRAFGHIREAEGEIVFNTSMAGYQEIITDPSNYGRVVILTYPLIGNYGLNLDDNQSDGPQIRALIVREKADRPSNWRNEIILDDYLKQHRIIGLEGIDTRALTKVIRQEGSMKAIITMRELSQGQRELHFKSLYNDLSFQQVSTKKKYRIGGKEKHVGIIDLGVRRDVIESLSKANLQLTVYPYNVSVDELMKDDFDGILISNGPGNPKDLMELVDKIKFFLGRIPVFGIGLGNQVLALSLGGEVGKMKYGHRGINLPVKDLMNNRILISSQNHGYEVIEEGLPKDIEISHRNINDGSVEGIENKKLKALGVDFYPDTLLYNKFINYMEGK